jgi:hypothetical protein
MREFQHTPVSRCWWACLFFNRSHRRRVVGPESGVKDVALSSVSKADYGLDGHGDERAITVAASL